MQQIFAERKPEVRPVYLKIDAELKKDLERYAAIKHMTLTAVVQSASMDYLRRQIDEMKTMEEKTV
jgi:hypothetical protein